MGASELKQLGHGLLNETVFAVRLRSYATIIWPENTGRPGGITGSGAKRRLRIRDGGCLLLVREQGDSGGTGTGHSHRRFVRQRGCLLCPKDEGDFQRIHLL